MTDSGPSPWIARFLGCATPGGTILDVACGGGRHLRYAMAQGYRVVGIDRDVSRVSDLTDDPMVAIIAADLEAGAPFPTGSRHFAGVIVSNYLWRPILSHIVRAVAAEGVLIYETFAAGHAALGGRPTNPDFLLRNNELAETAIAGGLTIIAYEHVHLTGARPRIVQRIAAVGPLHPWTSAPPIAT